MALSESVAVVVVMFGAGVDDVFEVVCHFHPACAKDQNFSTAEGTGPRKVEGSVFPKFSCINLKFAKQMHINMKICDS